jgi:hypothetical protein
VRISASRNQLLQKRSPTLQPRQVQTISGLFRLYDDMANALHDLEKHWDKTVWFGCQNFFDAFGPQDGAEGEWIAQGMLRS